MNEPENTVCVDLALLFFSSCYFKETLKTFELKFVLITCLGICFHLTLNFELKFFHILCSV